MSVSENLKKRLDINNDSDNYQYYNKKYSGLINMQSRLNVRGGTDQWTRMREDKLKGLKKALLSSYQSAIVQKYNVEIENLINSIKSIIMILQNETQELNETQKELLKELEKKYGFLRHQNAGSIFYINQLKSIIDSLRNEEPFFRCLINHDKLKVDYEDKIISIPFQQPPVGEVDSIETNFHNGTVFKWVHGNKEQWTPDTYWIVYMQYSEETAYFRAEIRKADEEIEIITVSPEGQQQSVTYRGWMTGPNETTAVWNVKKGVVWNDMNYTKLLYITKDQNTLAFFQRFDRIIINGKPWQVQAYNESYSTSKTAGVDTGIIRVALKQTYTTTDQLIKEKLQTVEDAEAGDKDESLSPKIEGPTTAKPYDILTYAAKNSQSGKEWTLSDSTLAKIIRVSEDGLTVKIEILTGKSNKKGFYIKYGDSEDTSLHVIIESF